MTFKIMPVHRRFPISGSGDVRDTRRISGDPRKNLKKALDKRRKVWYNIRVEGNAPLAQLVEQLTLNQWVLGSSPRWCTKRPVGQVVKTPPSHGGITSSNLVRVTSKAFYKALFL